MTRFELDGESRVSVPITRDRLPVGPWWDDEGACYEAVLNDGVEHGWYWQALNLAALRRGYVGQTLYEHPPLVLSLRDGPV